MGQLSSIVLTLLLSVAALVVSVPLALALFILVYGDRGRADPSLPPRSRWQLLRILVCELIPRLFAVIVLRRPLTEDEARRMRRPQAKQADAPAPEGPEGWDAGSPLPEAPARGGAGRYAEWKRRRQARRDKRA